MSRRWAQVTITITICIALRKTPQLNRLSLLVLPGVCQEQPRIAETLGTQGELASLLTQLQCAFDVLVPDLRLGLQALGEAPMGTQEEAGGGRGKVRKRAGAGRRRGETEDR